MWKVGKGAGEEVGDQGRGSSCESGRETAEGGKGGENGGEQGNAGCSCQNRWCSGAVVEV